MYCTLFRAIAIETGEGSFSKNSPISNISRNYFAAVGGSFGKGGSVYRINPPQNNRNPPHEEANPEPEKTREDLTFAPGGAPTVQGQGLLQDILNLAPKPPTTINLPKIELPDLNVRLPDLNINTDLGIVNLKRSNLRRQQGGTKNRQGPPRATGSDEGQSEGSFEEILKDVPDEG